MIEDLPRKGTLLMKRTFPGRHKLDPNKEAEQKLSLHDLGRLATGFPGEAGHV